jgi:RHS repeat-associated protein
LRRAGCTRGSADKTTTSYWDTSAIYSSTDGSNPVVRYDYIAEGQQTSRIPESAASPGTLDLTRAMYWDYLSDGLLRALLDIGGERVLYSYDGDGNQTMATHANGITTAAQAPMTVQSSFDGFDEQAKVRTQKPGASGTWLVTRYTYDLNGNPAQMVDSAEEDTSGTQTAEGRVFSYGYDSADQLVSQTDNFGTSGNSADDEQYAFVWTNDGHLNTRTILKANGASWTQEQKSIHSYYDNGALHTLTNYDGNNNVIEDHALAYISGSMYMNGNRVSDVYKLKNADGGSICFPTTCTATWTYDARDRLTQETVGTGGTTTYTLNVIGNVTQEAATGQPTITRTFNGQQLTTVTQGSVTSRYIYDSSGNVDCISDSSWTTSTCPASGNSALQTDYIYDYANRLAGARFFNGGTLTDSADYINDPLDRPISETETHSGSTRTTQFTYVGTTNAVSKEVVTGSTSTTKKYAYDGLGQRATVTDGANRYSYLYDAHGSVSLLVDQSNAVDASYAYSAYGSTNPAISKTAAGFIDRNPYKYTSKRFDSGSGTYDMGARRYSPKAGRWLEQDLYYNALDNLALSLDPLYSNRYLFTGANPINFVELDGHLLGPAVADGGVSIRQPILADLKNQAVEDAKSWAAMDCKDKSDNATCELLWNDSLRVAKKINILDPPDTTLLDVILYAGALVAGGVASAVLNVLADYTFPQILDYFVEKSGLKGIRAIACVDAAWVFWRHHAWLPVAGRIVGAFRSCREAARNIIPKNG